MWGFTAPEVEGWARVLILIVAILSLIAGLYLLRHPVLGVLLLGILLGIFWITAGILDLMLAISYQGLPRRWLTALAGGLGIVAGILSSRTRSPRSSFWPGSWVSG